MEKKSRRYFARKAAKELTKEITKIYKLPPQELQQWRQNGLLHLKLTKNASLMWALYNLAGEDLDQFGQLINYSKDYVSFLTSKEYLNYQAAHKLQLNSQPLPPDHPLVQGNPYHPLNPNNPRNLELNPALNLLFQEYINTQAAIEENEEEEKAENESHYEEEITALLASEQVQEALQQNSSYEHPNTHPYDVLGLTSEATPKEVAAACAVQLAQNAPAPDKTPSPEFHKIAAAVAAIATGTKQHDKDKGETLYEYFAKHLRPEHTSPHHSLDR